MTVKADGRQGLRPFARCASTCRAASTTRWPACACSTRTAAHAVAANFAALEIAHLRSHADLRVPYDWQSLTSSPAAGRLWHAVPRARRGARRWRGPAGSDARLFLDFCDALVERYALRDAETAHVASIGVVPPAVTAARALRRAPRRRPRNSGAARHVRRRPGHWLAGMRNLPWWADDLLKRSPPRAPTTYCTRRGCCRRRREGAAARRRSAGGACADGGGQTASRSSRSRTAPPRRRRRAPPRAKPFDIDLELMGDRRGQLSARTPRSRRTTASKQPARPGSMSPRSSPSSPPTAAGSSSSRR